MSSTELSSALERISKRLAQLSGTPLPISEPFVVEVGLAHEVEPLWVIAFSTSKVTVSKTFDQALLGRPVLRMRLSEAALPDIARSTITAEELISKGWLRISGKTSLIMSNFEAFSFACTLIGA